MTQPKHTIARRILRYLYFTLTAFLCTIAFMIGLAIGIHEAPIGRMEDRLSQIKGSLDRGSEPASPAAHAESTWVFPPIPFEREHGRRPMDSERGSAWDRAYLRDMESRGETNTAAYKATKSMLEADERDRKRACSPEGN